MTATRNDIVGWLEEAKQKGATHLIVACDTWDHDNYPVYVMPGEDVRQKAVEHGYDLENNRPMENGNMQVVDEVYSMAKPVADQLSQRRALNFD